MGLRWKGDYRAFRVEVTESFSDRKTPGQRREEVREPAQWLPKVGRRNPDSCQRKSTHEGSAGGKGCYSRSSMEGSDRERGGKPHECVGREGVPDHSRE